MPIDKLGLVDVDVDAGIPKEIVGFSGVPPFVTVGLLDDDNIEIDKAKLSKFKKDAILSNSVFRSYP